MQELKKVSCKGCMHSSIIFNAYVQETMLDIVWEKANLSEII